MIYPENHTNQSIENKIPSDTETVRKDLSIRMMVIMLFIILLLATVGIVGYIVYSNWLSSAEQTIAMFTEDMNIHINQEIDNFLKVPQDINVDNQLLIQNGIIDIKDELTREKFFVGVLLTHNNYVYSFSYGTETGEYYGARRNEKNMIEIMRNNASTDGHSWYYAVTDDMTAGERVVTAAQFDPRTRDWYKAAKEAKKLVFSPIYKHFIMNDLTVSVALPIYNENGLLNGVLGSHITLSIINNYLKDIVADKNAIAIIAEKKSGQLIANSLNLENFQKLQDGTIRRLTIEEIDNPAITLALNRYKNNEGDSFRIKSGNDRLHIDLTEYRQEGLDWLVITAVPESQFTAGIFNNMKFTLLLTIIALILAIVICLLITNKLMKPISNLIHSTEKFAGGDLSQRAAILRNDEIGRISKSFNQMADTLYALVNSLETKVKERTLELEQTNILLKENKNQLKLILDSTAEGIFGIDMEDNCTFCNASGLKMLGYEHENEFFGKKMHHLIHHSRKEGTPMPIEDCKILQTLQLGKGTNVDDEVFWRSDGTCFDVEYYSYPQYQDGKIIGAVITFTDNTERKRNQTHIRYLSYHDSLTGLYNRGFFEDELKRINTTDNLPISIIFGDINGLKLTNDIFGHAAGDALLKKSAEILKKVCREKDIIARVGGDEFAILLPNTEASHTEKIVQRVHAEIAKEQIAAIKCSVSLGYDTMTSIDENIELTLKNAEERMYKQKTLNRKDNNSAMVNTIIGTLHQKSPRERQHSKAVSKLCQDIAQAMNMTETEVRRLSQAGYLHDIGKIVLGEDLLTYSETFNEEQLKESEQHPVMGYRILNLFDETMDLAEGVLYHHEKWDGSGYPKGLKGEEIPKLARILSVSEAYDFLTNDYNDNPMDKRQALAELRKLSGLKYDPDIIDILARICEEAEFNIKENSHENIDCV